MGAAGSSIVDEDYSYYCDEFYPEGYYYQDLNYEEEGKSLTNKCEPNCVLQVDLGVAHSSE